jgi:hypothetical protein
MHGPMNIKTPYCHFEDKKRRYHSGDCDVAVVWPVKSTIYPDDGGNKIL